MNRLSQYFQYHLARLNVGVVFKDTAAQAAPFLQAVEPYLNGMNNSFLNMVCITSLPLLEVILIDMSFTVEREHPAGCLDATPSLIGS